MKRALALIAALAALAACTEKPQTLGGGSRQDSPAFQGTGMAYAVPGWKAGDQGSWEQQLKTRTQNQNDYSRVN